MSKSIGKNAVNVRKLNGILNKKIKIIPIPNGIDDVKTFFQNVVDPVSFKDIRIEDNEIIVAASTQSKAALIGRYKRKLLEMQKIIRDFFGKEFKVV